MGTAFSAANQSDGEEECTRGIPTLRFGAMDSGHSIQSCRKPTATVSDYPLTDPVQNFHRNVKRKKQEQQRMHKQITYLLHW